MAFQGKGFVMAGGSDMEKNTTRKRDWCLREHRTGDYSL